MALVTWKYSRTRGSNARYRPRDRARGRARPRDRAKNRRGVATVAPDGVKVVVKGDLTREESTRGEQFSLWPRIQSECKEMHTGSFKRLAYSVRGARS